MVFKGTQTGSGSKALRPEPVSLQEKPALNSTTNYEWQKTRTQGRAYDEHGNCCQCQRRFVIPFLNTVLIH